jgi:carbonic anhydrase
MNATQEARTRLRDGNARFAAGENPQPLSEGRRAELAEGQSPFAVVLSCSDSRVAPELLFDQALGDLFTVRVAGNLAAPTQIASIEFAVESFGCPLVLVLGHTNCGTVIATLDAMDSSVSPESMACLINEIRPAADSITKDSPDRINLVAEAHTRATVAKLLSTSSALRTRVESGDLEVQGALYSLATGEVAFFDEMV